ncbi:MAG: phage tail protein [Anaerolineaceae bacterium]|nr:phage tail protein [Anaerolineaceae bacterium]
MSDPFIAEVRIWAGNFAPRGWAFCNGQLLPIAQYTALFSLIGTIYGGDGRTTCALPDLQGRAPMHPGRGPGLSPRQIGQKGGVETVTLSTGQMAGHNHALMAQSRPGDLADPTNRSLARSGGGNAYHTADSTVEMDGQALVSAGGGQAHNNMQPYLALSFIIALQGLYPSRS